MATPPGLRQHGAHPLQAGRAAGHQCPARGPRNTLRDGQSGQGSGLVLVVHRKNGAFAGKHLFYSFCPTTILISLDI